MLYFFTCEQCNHGTVCLTRYHVEVLVGNFLISNLWRIGGVNRWGGVWKISQCPAVYNSPVTSAENSNYWGQLQPQLQQWVSASLGKIPELPETVEPHMSKSLACREHMRWIDGYIFVSSVQQTHLSFCWKYNSRNEINQIELIVSLLFWHAGCQNATSLPFCFLPFPNFMSVDSWNTAIN